MVAETTNNNVNGNKPIELVGRVFSVRYREPDSGFTVANLKSGATVVGNDMDAVVTPGVQLRFYGKWKEHDSYGSQFRFDSVAVDLVHDQKGIVEYLSKICENIGDVRAQRLWEKYRADAVTVLRDTPDRVVSDGVLPEGIASVASSTLKSYSDNQLTTIDLLTLFAGRSFSRDLIGECIKAWGTKAPHIIRRNPFILLVKRMPGCGFTRVDALYLSLGGRPDALKRQTLAAWHEMQQDRNGHTWFSPEVLASKIEGVIGVAKAKVKKALKLGIRARMFAKRKDANGDLWLTQRVRAIDEAEVSRHVVRLLGGG